MPANTKAAPRKTRHQKASAKLRQLLGTDDKKAHRALMILWSMARPCELESLVEILETEERDAVALQRRLINSYLSEG